MRRADVGSAEREPERIVPSRGKTTEYDVESPVDERRDVLDEDERRGEFPDESVVLVPKAASSTSEASLAADDADVLAGEAAAQDVGSLDVLTTHLSDVAVLHGTRPVPLEYGTGARVNLTLPDGVAEAGALEPQLEPTDPSKQGRQLHR